MTAAYSFLYAVVALLLLEQVLVGSPHQFVGCLRAIPFGYPGGARLQASAWSA